MPPDGTRSLTEGRGLKSVRVLSHSAEAFRDRGAAGRLLAEPLARYRASRPVVLGIPRGGVIVAAEAAAGIGAELDVVLVRKLGAPSNPELAIGAVGEDGRLFLDEALAARVGAGADYVARQRLRQLEEIARRVRLYRANREKIPLAGRVAIVTDDGLATGATMRAALLALREERPERLVVAVPVGAPETLERIADAADEVLCLRAPHDFSAVGMFYRDFTQVPDEEVLAVLRAAGP